MLIGYCPRVVERLIVSWRISLDKRRVWRRGDRYDVMRISLIKIDDDFYETMVTTDEGSQGIHRYTNILEAILDTARIRDISEYNVRRDHWR